MNRITPIVLFCAAALSAVAQDPYNETPSYARSRDFDLQHIKLELSFDLNAQKLLGTATLRMAPLSGDLREVALDSNGLDIESVTLAGRPLQFHTGGDKLYLALDRQYPAGEALEFSIRYHTQPKRGMFFVLPDKFHPDRPKQIWANGDTAGGNNRFWFPGYDFPNDKATTEMIVTVPTGWQVLSNGKLVSENKSGSNTVFHWSQDKPMSTYLISVVAGEFDKGSDPWRVPVEFYVPHGKAADIPRTFGRTTQMLQFFSDNVAPYPWAKYDQAMVDTFGGGMENTSATTEGAAAILDARDFEDRKVGTDSLIAHEMAHQWFGDLVTCADWRHSWLNEGFATYFEALWEEHARGRDFFDWNELRAARGIVASHSPYAVVPREGQDLTAAYSMIYNKGGWTLQMVRGQLGDARFWKAIQYYAKKFSYQNATTADFVEAVAEATGQDLEWLFDQYVYHAGNPDFDASWDYDAGVRLLHVTLRQTQKVDGKPAPFHVPVEIEALSDGSSQTFKFWISKEAEDLYFSLPQRPQTVLFDPRDILLKDGGFKKPAAEWIWQLQHSARVLNRSEAAVALGAFNTAEVIEALERAGTSDAFWGVRIDAANSLGRIRNSASRTALAKMLTDREAEVRTAAASGLGSQEKDAAITARLFEVARSDSSYSVRRAALQSVARWKPDNALDQIKPFLADEAMRAAAVQSLAILSDKLALPLLLEYSNDRDDNVRRTALRSLGGIGHSDDKARERLLDALAGDKGDRQAAIAGLSVLHDPSTAAALEQLAQSEPLPAIARSAHAAAESLRGGDQRR